MTLELQRRRMIAMKIANGFMRMLPRSVCREDIEQAAMIGLWKALKKPREPDTTDAGHEWFIRCRIRGAVLDELRAQDWLPRRARDGSLGEQVEIVRWDDIRSAYDWQDRIGNDDPSVEIALDVDQEAAEAMRAPLCDKDRRVVELVVFGGNRQTDVANEMGVSEARVSQRYAHALDLMHRHLKNGEPRPATLKYPIRRRPQ